MKTLQETTFSQRVLLSRLLTAEQLAAARSEAGDDDRNLALHLVRQGLLTPYQARQLRAGVTGFHVGKYVVVDLIGRGSHSVVFKARHTLLPGRYAALKTLDTRSLHHSDQALARFRREIEVLCRLEHPNIVRAYDLVQTRQGLFLVLEYIEGCDLGQLVRKRGPLPVHEAVELTLQAARGLAYAHRHDVVHRDLKPANLLLTKDGLVKLADLGLARVHTGKDSSSELTLKGQCMGTPEFMAPEQAEDATRADSRSDLYSLGATLFHLLTGRLPVNGNSYMHCLTKLLTTPPPPLAEARPDVPPGLAAVVDRLRARNPFDRPASAEELIALLEPYARKPNADNPRLWDGRRKVELVLQVFLGELSAEDACRGYGLTKSEFDDWQRRFLEGAEQALDPASPTSREALQELHAKIGTQAMEIEKLRKRLATLGDPVSGVLL